MLGLDQNSIWPVWGNRPDLSPDRAAGARRVLQRPGNVFQSCLHKFSERLCVQKLFQTPSELGDRSKSSQIHQIPTYFPYRSTIGFWGWDFASAGRFLSRDFSAPVNSHRNRFDEVRIYYLKSSQINFQHPTTTRGFKTFCRRSIRVSDHFGKAL